MEPEERDIKGKGNNRFLIREVAFEKKYILSHKESKELTKILSISPILLI